MSIAIEDILSICKLLYISDLQVKRQKSGDVNSEQIEKDEDLTHLTFVNYKKMDKYGILQIMIQIPCL